MRPVPSLKSLLRSSILLASSFTLLEASTLAQLVPVKADETAAKNTTNEVQVTRHTGESLLPPVERTAHIGGSQQGSAEVLQGGKNQYIDTKEYEVKAKEFRYASPSKVVITERRSTCQTVIEQGQLKQGQCNLAKKPAVVTVANNNVQSTPTINNIIAKRERPVAPIQVNNQQRLNRRLSAPPVQVASIGPLTAYQQPSIETAPLNAVYPQLALEAVPLEYNRATVQPISTPTANRTSLMFPLPIPAAISSAFGWRIHPITGGGRMHTGTDIAAPIGTPVLAAYPGEVEQAGWTDGYGLMISLLHEGKTQESRYAHLSEIYVKPGEWVEQGTVIGRVGSTGFSTGPHLHFEWRHLTVSGSIPVDAGVHLQYALDNLIYSLQRAEVDKPQG